MQDTKLKIILPSVNIIYEIFAIILGLILPLLLIPVIKFTGYSEIIEEIFKTLVILFVILKISNNKVKIITGFIFGILFGISENFLFLNQIFQSGDLNIFWLRFLWTVPMHIITVMIILFTGIIKKKYLIFGLIGAITLHFIFNYFIVNIIK